MVLSDENQSETEVCRTRALTRARNAMRLQTGYLYHYAFAMLIGAALLITWFMFAGGAH